VRAIDAAVALAHRAGITSVHNAPASNDDLQAFARLRRSGEMRLRIYQLLQGSATIEASALTALDRVRADYPEVPLFKIGAVRLATAAVMGDPAALAASVAQLDQAGYSVVVEADDPAALATIVGAFGQVRGAASFASRRHRVELGEALDPSDPDVEAAAARLTRSGVAVSTVPSYPLDPLASIAAEIQPGDANYGAHLRQAIDRATSLAARASFDEQRKGTLAAGMLADLVILSADLFATPPVDLSTVTVDMTVFDGKIVHDRRALSQTTR
jgi:predicted amidohydrolase YtcJ